MLATAWPFIEIDDQGRPRIQGTGIKVLLLIQQSLNWSWDAEQVRENYPQLSMAQIHAALGYYYEYREECDRWIAEDERRVDELLPHLVDDGWQEKMRRIQAESERQQHGS